MLNCPYCGSSRLQTTGGENGNPFNRQPEKTICLYCRRTIGSESYELNGILPEVPAEELNAIDELTKHNKD